MMLRRSRIGMYVAVAAAILAIFAWRRLGNDWAVEDKFIPPPFPSASSDAQPVLVSSGPLPSIHQSAKPVVAVDHEGQVVVIAQDLIPPRGSRIVQWTSRAHGQSWEPARVLEGSPGDAEFLGDPWLTTDRRGRFYCLYVCVRPPGLAILFHRSSDGGRIWSSPIQLPLGDRPVLGVSPDGKLLVVAASLAEKSADYPSSPLDGNDPRLAEKIEAAYRFSSGVFISKDRGRSWQQLPGPLPDTHAIPFSVVVDDDGRIAGSWVAKGGGSRSVVCSTLDRGLSWTETELVANLQPDRPHPFNGERFPVVAVDGSRKLHVAYVSERAKALLVRSSHDWRGWQAATQLSDSDVQEVRMPAIAAWGSMVHVVWMERRDRRWQAYYRGSSDHGVTWSKRILLSVPHAGCMLVGDAGFEITSDDDQSSVTDDGLGNMHVVWSVRGRQRNECGTVWHALVRRTRGVTPGD